MSQDFEFNQNQPGQTPPGQTPPPKSSVGKIILIIVGILGLVSLCCCGGIFGLTYFGFGQMSNKVTELYGDHPAVVENIGSDLEISYDFGESVKYQQETQEQKLVFKVKGSVGSGLIVCDQAPGEQLVSNGVLVTESGEEIPLD